jgi:hypothetical protein
MQRGIHALAGRQSCAVIGPGQIVRERLVCAAVTVVAGPMKT